MYRVPSRKAKKHAVGSLNLIPILDSVFIFVFFLLMTTTFSTIFEISSDVPIVSDVEPPKTKKKPLALTLKIRANSIDVYTGLPGTLVMKVKKKEGEKEKGKEFDLDKLHDFLLVLKKKNVTEKSIIFEPLVDVRYEELVAIMDSVRVIKGTDPAIYTKGKDGIDIKVDELFPAIVFGNIQS